MKNLGLFLLKVFGIVAIALFALWMVSLIWGNFHAYPECPECVCDAEEVVFTTPTDTPTGDVTFTQGEKVCRFAEGYTSEGKVVPKGTTVTGPALVKPDRDIDHVILVMPDAEYTTVETDEVIWLLVGDPACVNSQAKFFSTSETIEN